MRNKSLNHTLSVLSHPIVIGAVVLLLVNDHILRRLWPSVITGKLGDAAWLVFAPLMVAPLIALLFPNRRRLTGLLSIGITGVGFALIKTVGPIHAITQAGLSWMLGWPSGLRRDPTDLLMLPALGLTWWLWTKTRTRQNRAISPVVLAFALFATTANTPAPMDGIDCLFIDDNQIVNAMCSWGGPIWTTQDGGLTWEQTDFYDWENDPHPECLPYGKPRPTLLTLEDPSNPSISYRISVGDSVQRSEDSGASWVEEFDLSLSDAQTTYYEIVEAHIGIAPGPMDAEFDPKTGNLILGMGLQGVAVRTPDGGWQRVDVDRHEYVEIKTLDIVWELLLIEFLLSIVLGTLFPAVICLLTDEEYMDKNPTKSMMMVIACILWSIMVFYAPAKAFPTVSKGHMMIFFFPIVMLFGLLSAIFSSRHMKEYLGRLDNVVQFSLVTMILFILPYILWTQAIIPTYNFAMITALALTVAAMASAVWWFRTHVELHEETGNEASEAADGSE
jgi:hypothetical protein